MTVTFSALKWRRLALAVASISIITACATLPFQIDRSATAPKLDGFGATTLQPSRIKPEAQALFAQGMAQVYAFNEKEAIRDFKAALAIDPGCAMCAWGVAYQLGPNINSLQRGDLTEAIRYTYEAKKNSAGSSQRDLDLIASLSLRYGQGSLPVTGAGPQEAICRKGNADPADPLDIAYADRMRQLAERYPDDPDILAIYAEAEMVATRGDFWDAKTGTPTGLIGDVATRIELALARWPEHVGLNHYMIHAADAPVVAKRAEAAADRLGGLAPRSAHLLHMPSHTFAHLGRFADAARVNQLAVAADVAQFATLKEQKFEKVKDWRGHNWHFLWYASLTGGDGELALKTAREIADGFDGKSYNSEYMRSLPALTLLHLQRWDALAAEPIAWGDKGMAKALGEMGRGIAMVNKGQLQEGKAAQARVDAAVELALQGIKGGDRFSKMLRSLLNTAPLQLKAAVALAEGHKAEAVALQTKAVEAAVDANLNEPPMLAEGPRLRLAAMQQGQAVANR